MHEYAMLTAIHREASNLQIDFNPVAALLWLVSAPFYVIGWLIGFLWRSLLWCVAACVTGFKAGRG
jgi:hypothetical protein